MVLEVTSPSHRTGSRDDAASVSPLLCEDSLLLTGATAFESAVLLSRETSVPNRLGAIDQLCPTRIAILQYHDDNVASVAFSEQVAAVCNAADEYTRVHGGTFNMTTGKSATVPIGHTRFAHDEDMRINGQPLQHASSHPHLGVIIDRWLYFALHLQQRLARAQRAFEDFVGCAQSLGLPLSVAAARFQYARTALWATHFEHKWSLFESSSFLQDISPN